MFSKKCPHCEEKIKKQFNFCPYCGKNISESAGGDLEDFGLLGKNDLVSSGGNVVKVPKGFDSLFNFFLNGLDNQMKGVNDAKKNRKQKPLKKGFSISISTSNGKMPEINLKPLNQFKKRNPNNVSSARPKNFLKKHLRGFSRLPQEEPHTEIRRFSDKVVYEFELPGVKSLEDISIHELENSLEVRATSAEKAFFKLIPIGLPIMRSDFRKGRLVLELALEE